MLFEKDYKSCLQEFWMNGAVVEERFSAFRLDTPGVSGSIDGVLMHVGIENTVRHTIPML